MKKIVLIVGISMLFGGMAFGKMPYTKETGLKCDQCHEAGKPKKDPSSNDLYKTAAEHSKMLKAGKGTAGGMDFAGKKSCNECHQGKPKPKA